MMRFKAGTLPQLTEKEFRDYAFTQSPEGLDSGGLTMVALVATELLPVIASIPGKEFDPRLRQFRTDRHSGSQNHRVDRARGGREQPRRYGFARGYRYSQPRGRYGS